MKLWDKMGMSREPRRRANGLGQNEEAIGVAQTIPRAQAAHDFHADNDTAEIIGGLGRMTKVCAKDKARV